MKKSSNMPGIDQSLVDGFVPLFLGISAPRKSRFASKCSVAGGVESFRLPKFPEHRQGSLAYMEALVRSGQGFVSTWFFPGAEQGQSQSQESAAKGQEKSHKSEPGPAAFPESWRAGKRGMVAAGRRGQSPELTWQPGCCAGPGRSLP